MVSKVILYISIIILIFSYILIYILYLKYKNKKDKNTGLDISLNILDNSNINVIENKTSIYSFYDTKRKVIKLSTKTYNSNNIFSIYISWLLSSYSKIDQKYFILLNKIGIHKIRFISISSIIILLISSISNTITDSKLGLIIVIFITIYQYLLNTISEEIILIDNNLNKDIKDIYNKIYNINKLLFINSLIQIIRFIIIIFEIF